MFAHFLRPKNLSQKMLRVIFSIYFCVTVAITGVQFVTEYFTTQNAISNELKILENTILGPISTGLWQFDQSQLTVIIDGLINNPIVEGVDIFDNNAEPKVSIRAYKLDSAPVSMFHTESDLEWLLNGENVYLGKLILYSSSDVVLDRVFFGFSLIAITAIVKLTILFGLFVWAFDRYLAKPLRELMSQVESVQMSQSVKQRIHLSGIEQNELSELQDHMNKMLLAIEEDREHFLESEQAKRNWLESAVAKRTNDLQILNEKLKDLATKDSLTNILNRGSFFEAAQRQLLLSIRKESPASFILMDLDYFKKINDTYGHFVGDKVLIHFTQTIQSFLRESDLIGRVGGEEFAIFLPDTGKDASYYIADKLRIAIGHSTLEVDDKTVTYTVSMGVATSEPKDQTIDELFKRADVKLYDAKDKGRDRVEK